MEMLRKGVVRMNVFSEDAQDPRYEWQEKQVIDMKKKKQLLEFKASTYRNALTRQKKAYAKLIEGQASREKGYKPMFKTREELDEYYDQGTMTPAEYRREKTKIWQVYSDRGHIQNIAWLEEELAEAERKLALFAEKQKELENVKYRYYPSVRRRRKTNYERGRRRRIRKKELQERWKKHGIG